jgi:hypothetical protein
MKRRREKRKNEKRAVFIPPKKDRRPQMTIKTPTVNSSEIGNLETPGTFLLHDLPMESA